MPVYNTIELCEKLKQEVESQISRAKHLLNLPPQDLLKVPANGGWNIAQVLEHLNTYNAYYNSEIETGLTKSKHESSLVFSSGILGNYFANSMLPKSGKVNNKMKAFKNHSPQPDLNAEDVVRNFINYQEELKGLIVMSSKANLTKIKIPISISRFIRLRLGDTLRFLIAHQQRHFVQLENIEAGLRGFAPNTYFSVDG